MNPIFCFLFFLQAAVQPTQSPTQQQKPTTPAAQQKQMEALAHMMQPSKSIMIIDPKQRAMDYQKAWERLKQEKSTAKVFFELSDGSKLSNIIDMQLMPDNTLVIFRFSTPQGIRYQVVEIEDIVGITHQ